MTERGNERSNVNKKLPTIVLMALMAVGVGAGYRVGYAMAKREIPSCIYLQRPRTQDVKPLGYDGKEGVDWHCDRIEGGGLYVSLEKWKNPK